MRFAAAVLMLVEFTVTGAAQDRKIRDTVEPHSVRRSPMFSLKAGNSISLRTDPSANPALSLTVEVYDDEQELAGRDDSEADVAEFTWEAPRDGKYYVIVRNASAVAGAYSISIDATGASKGPQPPATHAVVKIFYATDRVQAAAGTSGASFGTEPGSGLIFGTSTVSVPRGHKMGELEGPSILRLEFRQNPEKYVVLLRTGIETPGRFFAEVSARAAESSERQAFVFVHGFNTTFEDAVRRTAQIAYDLQFAGTPILFSWPSQGSAGLVAYNKDGRNAELSGGRLEAFLQDLVTRTGVKTVHVIAHSMGNRLVARALDGIAATSGVKPVPQLRQVALVAPDIDAEQFRALAARIKTVPARLTLYASSGDGALKASQLLAGYRRAGQGGTDIVVVPGLDTIDASEVDTSVLGLRHSYFADNRTILSDLFYLIRGVPAGERAGLRGTRNRDGQYWMFAPAVR